MTIYGIKSCDSVKKAQVWLQNHHIDFDFHDYKEKGIDKTILKRWCRQIGRDRLVNKQSTTWRQLTDEAKASVVDDESAIALMKANTSLIKRPVIEKGSKVVVVGYNEAEYGQLLG